MDCIRLSCIVFSDPIVAMIQRLRLLILAGSDIEGGGLDCNCVGQTD